MIRHLKAGLEIGETVGLERVKQRIPREPFAVFFTSAAERFFDQHGLVVMAMKHHVFIADLHGFLAEKFALQVRFAGDDFFVKIMRPHIHPVCVGGDQRQQPERVFHVVQNTRCDNQIEVLFALIEILQKVSAKEPTAGKVEDFFGDQAFKISA